MNTSYKVLKKKGIPNTYSASAHQGITEVYKVKITRGVKEQAEAQQMSDNCSNISWVDSNLD